MLKRYLILLPQGIVASNDEKTQEACLDLATRCCGETRRIMTNPTRDLNPYMDRLDTQDAEAHTAPVRVVIVLTIPNPIGALFRARMRLMNRFPHFERALWIVYVESFTESFLAAAKRFGTLSDDVDHCPQWNAADYGTFLLFTPRTMGSLIDIKAKAHWRNVDPPEGGLPSQRRKSQAMRAIHPPPRPSGDTPVHVPAIAAPASDSSLSDPLFKKP